VSPRLESAVDRALAKDPGRRFPSMAAFAQELRACLAEIDGAAPPPPEDATLITRRPSPPGAPARARPRSRARSRRRPLLWALLAIVAAAVAFAAVVLLGGGGHHSGGSGGGGGSTGSAVRLQGVEGYDPQGTGGEHDELAGNATDGNPSTAWTTETYDSPDFGGLKDGVGLMLDTRSSVELSQVTVTTPTPGFTAEIQSGNSPAGVFTPDSSSKTVTGTTTFALNGNTARYYVVWITQLPGDRAEISEVTAKS
jgi:hypothetical protein